MIGMTLKLWMKSTQTIKGEADTINLPQKNSANPEQKETKDSEGVEEGSEPQEKQPD
jgi:hypothetical protein